MPKTPTLLFCIALCSGMALAMQPGTAQAGDDCFVPMADWQPRRAVADLAATNEWTVRRIKIDDGCYEIDGTDASGQRIEVKLHPATLQVIEIEYKGERGDRNQRGRRSD